ncbi:probable F-box protein At3g61730 [Benincasa hispida]|uniref:probable F-box protein At3g61730 n=1 Tax=Benincasa hispida TaxID=102211 RepID=UPI0019017645|nr:probable F-box protein At3g61730 [Benincasa hispida]
MGKKLSIASARDRVVTRSLSIAMERAKMSKRSSPNSVVAAEPEGTVKRMRRDIKPIHSCSSPRSAFLTAHSSASSSASSSSCWYDADVWTEVAKFLDGRSLMMLAATSRWFYRLVMEDSIWKYVCLRDLQVPAPQHTAFKWIKLYVSAFDGSHSYIFRQQEKHLDWMRIGAFFLDSSVALLSERLGSQMKIPKQDSTDKTLESGCCVLHNVKTGIWIADLQLVRCPVCDLNTCDGTMQTLDARHIELFLNEGYQDGSWEYQIVGSHDIRKPTESASGAIFDVKHLKDSSTSGILDLKSWTGSRTDWQPKAMITLNAVAVNTYLQDNEGVHVKYQAMKAGANGEVVSIRISQQLL